MVETAEFVVMPNHFHGIIAIADVRVGADLRVGPASNRNGANGSGIFRSYPTVYRGEPSEVGM
jgi:hypothetical protein